MKPKNVAPIPALAVVALFAMSGCRSPSSVPEWCAGSSPEVAVHLTNESSPRELRLTELWRVGGLEGSEVFARPSRPSVSAEGRVAVPDMMTSSVILIEPDGTWKGSVVREGDGPGEVRMPVDVEWVAGDRLSIFDLAKGVVVTISDGGEFEGHSWRVAPELYARVAASGSLPGGDLVSDGSLILELPWESVGQGPHEVTSTVVHIHADGSIDTLQSQPVSVVNERPWVNWPLPGMPRPVYATGAGGPIFLGGADENYKIRVLSTAGADTAVICRLSPPLELSAAERGQGQEPAQLMRMFREASATRTPAAYGRLIPGERGRLWVMRDRPDPVSGSPVEGGQYDLYDEAGRLVGSLRVPARVYLFGEGGHQVYGFERGDLDELSLVAYALGP